MDHQQLARVFSAKYSGEDGDWNGSSGPGSDPFYTLPYRAFLEEFLRLNAIGSMVDIGCGDWQFSRFLDLRGIDYHGFDLAGAVVERNRRLFGSDRVRFDVMPEELDALPGAHLLVMKDVLQHLSLAQIARFREIVFPKYIFCLLTNSYAKLEHDGRPTPQNTDVTPGGFRCLDLRMAPFHLPGAYVLRFPAGTREELRTLLVQRPG